MVTDMRERRTFSRLPRHHDFRWRHHRDVRHCRI